MINLWYYYLVQTMVFMKVKRHMNTHAGATLSYVIYGSRILSSPATWRYIC
jgi:hypothetical protein